VTEAGKSLHGITGVEVVKWTVDVTDNRITTYKVTLHVAFQLDESRG